MSGPTAGHRHAKPASPRRSRLSGTPSVVAWTVMVIAGAVAVVGALGWWVARDSTRSPEPAVASPPPSDTAPPSTPASSAATVATTRVVSIDGRTVTVEERSEVSGGSAEATPVTTTPLGLELLELTTIGSDRRSEPFVDPRQLSPSASLTVRGRYRVTDCPDLLPAAWPTPADFAGSTRTYLRVEEPLHTARAVCPDAISRARPLEGLTGTIAQGGGSTAAVPTVRLRWDGGQALEIAAVGSASGVAALPVELGCGGSCVAQLTPDSTVDLTLQPIDPCPPATEDDTLTLQRQGGEVVSVTVDGLHRAVCGR